MPSTNLSARVRAFFSPENTLYILIILAILLNLSGLFDTILGPDGNLYASIAKNMVLRSDYLQLFGDGREWLDKPHFPFWVTALFFKLFGFTTWAYKLPAVLFLFGAAGYTYLFAKRLYNRQVALWAVLILLTAEHIVISNNDVRAEPYLTALIIGAVYHFYRCIGSKNFMHLLLGALFTACAVMTKGMFALIPIGGALAGELVIKKRWKELFHVRWLIAGVLVMVFITPELYSLYYQFDAHPEKTVFGRQGVSGIRFFFWDSQFGRFFNTGPIKGKGDPSFFLHTTLWAFLPWSIVLYIAIVQFIRKGIREPLKQEWYCISAALITFLLFSASKFQLPHYLNIVFPFFAIITAQYLLGIQNVKETRRIQLVQTVLIAVLLISIILLDMFLLRIYDNILTGLLTGAMIWAAGFIISAFSRQEYLQRTMFRTALASIVINLYLNLCFYPELLKYQSGSEAAFWVNKNNTSRLPVAQMVHEQYAFALDFYLNQALYTIDTVHNKYPATPFLLYLNSPDKQFLLKKGWQLESLKEFEHYPVSRIKFSFINSRKRPEVISVYELVKVVKH